MADVVFPLPLLDVQASEKHINDITVTELLTNGINGWAKCRPDGTPTTKPSTRRNGDNGYYRNEELGGPIHSERHMRVVVIGAGASGLCFAYKLQRSFQNFDLKLFEKNPDISGTWYENRYPGYVSCTP